MAPTLKKLRLMKNIWLNHMKLPILPAYAVKHW